MRIVLLVFVLVTAPTAAFFLWAWAGEDQAGAQARRHPAGWQDMPMTWLAIAGLACTIAGFLVMFFTQDQGYGGLFAS
jgi:hypothetical protein